MSMRVPVYEQQVGVQSPAPAEAPRLQPAPQAAFGGAMAQAQGALGETIGQIGEVLSRHIERRNQQETERQALESETAFRQEMQATLYSPEPDEAGVPKGIFNRRLGAAKGATVALDTAYSKLREKYISAATTDAQREVLGRLMDSHYSQERDAVVRHEAAQFNENYANTLEANVNQRISDAAGITDPKALIAHLGQTLAIQKAGFNRMGLDEASQKAGRQDLAGKMLLSALKPAMETAPDKARDFLSRMKNDVPADLYAQVEGKVIEADFNNTLQKLKQAGGDKQEALKLAEGERFVRNDTDRADRITEVNKAYAQTQPFIYRSLFKGVQAGTVKEAELDAALQAGTITQTDWDGLWKMTVSARSGKTLPPEMKRALDIIELKVNETYKDKQKRDEAMYVIEQKALLFPNPDVFQAEALKSLDSVVVSPGVFWDTEKTRYEVELEEMRAASADNAARINQAVAVLERTHTPVVPENVKHLLDLWEKNPNDRRLK